MSNLFEPLRRFFAPFEPIEPGIYHYQAPPDDPRNYRLHLRLEEDGRGILIVNAATVLHLNETAALYAYYFIQNTPGDEVARQMAARYHVSPTQAQQDYQDIAAKVLTLIETPDLDPVTFLDMERQAPYSGKIAAPYRLDCALTYRLPEGVDPDVAPTKRVDRELSTSEWQTIIDKAWGAGIPHVIFTGGEPTLRDDLVALIAHAEKNGQVSGLLTNGLRLGDPAYLEALLQTGLDHLLIRLSADEAVWQGLQAALDEDIYTAVHLTLTPENAGQAPEILARLAEMGVPAVSLSAASDELDETLAAARDLVAELDMHLIWDLPVPYSTHNPVALETAENDAPEGTGRAWLYVEPDGDVLPAQGVNQVLGNLLRDPWEQIWKPARE